MLCRASILEKQSHSISGRKLHDNSYTRERWLREHPDVVHVLNRRTRVFRELRRVLVRCVVSVLGRPFRHRLLPLGMQGKYEEAGPLKWPFPYHPQERVRVSDHPAR